MKFSLLRHEELFLQQLDDLIVSTEDVDKKILLIDRKINFIKNLMDFERDFLKHDLECMKQEDSYRLNIDKKRNS
ncbi:hypothetical protein IC800_18810 (plasmid) [Acinetobacter seifertii]|uniref:hypothetical protein n=1 Tax=Acinetobacter seifertii TaxID=1530123 RepID=UPI00168D2B1C|nr:hypothetical protein [Acinetobacter seifertii]QNW96597.1 hypothetical protein IC800_18810 [Acinetobacter seifertii]QNX03722.1 hypothetical protein IC798_19040 [Acinetobacter seifertii]